MSYSKTPAQRIDEMLSQLAPLDDLCDVVADWRAAEIRHARTYRDDDMLDAIKSLDEVLCIIERASGLDFSTQRGELADQARDECSYDLREECHLNHLGEPIVPPPSFGASHPDAGRGFRL